MMRTLSARWPDRLLTLVLLAGCAGQLDLAPEAYQSNAQTATGNPGSSDGNDAGIGSALPVPWPASDAAGWAADAGGPATGGAGPAPGAPGYGRPDAGWVADAPAAANGGAGAAPTAVDAASLPAPAAACPAGVDAIGLIAKRCGGCHGDRAPTKGLDLVTPGLADRLVGIKSTCPNRQLLDAPPAGTTAVGEPTGHFLDKLEGPVDGCGAQMPYGAPALTSSEFDCIVEWAARAGARGKK
jgi:hypothetical protein